jgi:DNA-directed RNA polymerase specialized sigma24 family protein
MHLPVPAQNDDAAVQDAPAQDGDAKTALVELLEGSLADPNGDEAAGRDGRTDEEGTETARDPEQAQQAAERAGEAEVPGYRGPFATREERDALPRDKALLEKLRKTACKHVPASDVEDVLQETLTAACRAPRLPGGSGEECRKYAFGILRFKIADHWEDQKKQQDIAEKAEAHAAAQAVDADHVGNRDFVDKLVTFVKPHQHSDLRCLLRHKIRGVPMTTIARERGEEYEAFAKRMNRLWRQLQTAVSAMGGAFVLLFVLLQPRPERPLAVDEPGEVALTEPAVSTHYGEADPMNFAKVLRGEAFRACMNNKWQECLDGLDAARELDPAGDSDWVVAAAREDAKHGTGRTEKPMFGRWTPPVVRAYAERAARW